MVPLRRISDNKVIHGTIVMRGYSTYFVYFEYGSWKREDLNHFAPIDSYLNA